MTGTKNTRIIVRGWLAVVLFDNCRGLCKCILWLKYWQDPSTWICSICISVLFYDNAIFRPVRSYSLETSLCGLTLSKTRHIICKLTEKSCPFHICIFRYPSMSVSTVVKLLPIWFFQRHLINSSIFVIQMKRQWAMQGHKIHYSVSEPRPADLSMRWTGYSSICRSTQSHTLEQSQRTAALACTWAYRDTSHSILLSELGWPTLAKRREYFKLKEHIITTIMIYVMEETSEFIMSGQWHIGDPSILPQ